MLCLNNAIFEHTECIKHQKYLAQMGSNTKTISKLGKVCGTFMKVSFFILSSVKTNICLRTQLQVCPGDKRDAFHSVFFLQHLFQNKFFYYWNTCVSWLSLQAGHNAKCGSRNLLKLPPNHLSGWHKGEQLQRFVPSCTYQYRWYCKWASFCS